MKGIILTNAPISETETRLLIHTKIQKFAINAHAQHLKPDFRICSDYDVTPYLLAFFPQKVISTREFSQCERIIYAGHIPFKGSTLVASVDYLISENFKEILIIGTNTVHEQFFQNRIKKEIDLIIKNNQEIKIYQYSDGNFNLPVKSIADFIKE